MEDIKRVVIVHNSVSENPEKDEQDTLDQVEAVSETLAELGFSVLKLTVSFGSLHHLYSLTEKKPLFVFNLVDTVRGEGKFSFLIPYILDYMNINYTGCSGESIFLTTNKIVTKKLLHYYSVKTPEWIGEYESNGFVPRKRYIIKAVYEDASIALDTQSVVHIDNIEELREMLLLKRKQTGMDFFAERYIEGREFSISMLGIDRMPLVLPPAEIEFAGHDEKNNVKIVDYKAKWEEDTFEFKSTFGKYDFSREDETLLEELKRISILIWDKFSLRGYARVDFRVDEDGKPWALEINANPCLNPIGSSFINAATYAGLDYRDVITRIISEI